MDRIFYQSRISHLASLVMVVLILFSCRSNDSNDGSLVYWSSNNPQEMSFGVACIEQWNEARPENPISFQPVPEGRSSEEVILAAVVGKTTPDIYANMWQGEVEDFARAGVLIPLDTLDGFLSFLYNRCDSDVIKEITASDGHIYQVPWKVNPIMIMYNPDFFAQAGASTDIATYSKYLDAASKIKADRDGDGYTDQWMGISEVNAIWWQRLFNFVPLYYAASGGAPLVKNGKAAFDNEYGRQVFAFLQEIYINDYFPQEERRGQADQFLTKRVASRITGPWAIENAERFKPEGFRYQFHPMPVPNDHEGPVYTYCDPKNIVIFNTCKDPQLAWEFLETMLSAERDLEFLKTSLQLPRRKDLLENPLFTDFFSANEKMMPFARQSKYLRGIDSEPNMKAVLDLISQEYEASVVYGMKSPEDAIRDAAKAVDLLYLK